MGTPRAQVFEGFVSSTTAGLNDRHALLLEVGSFVLPADTASGLANGNSLAGAAALDRMFPRDPRPAKFADAVPRILAGGEYVVGAYAVRAVGEGEEVVGAEVLDRFAVKTRAEYIKELQARETPAEGTARKWAMHDAMLSTRKTRKRAASKVKR